MMPLDIKFGRVWQTASPCTQGSFIHVEMNSCNQLCYFKRAGLGAVHDLHGANDSKMFRTKLVEWRSEMHFRRSSQASPNLLQSHWRRTSYGL